MGNRRTIPHNKRQRMLRHTPSPHFPALLRHTPSPHFSCPSAPYSLSPFSRPCRHQTSLFLPSSTPFFPPSPSSVRFLPTSPNLKHPLLPTLLASVSSRRIFPCINAAWWLSL